MHHALAASCYSVDAAFRNMRLVRICGSYLWPASLPKEPMVRRGLEGLTQEGSGVFCTSVLTSGSISEGEGVSLAPAMALCLPSVTSSRERPMRVFLLVSEQTQSATEKSHPRLYWRCTKAEVERLAPCRITGSSDTLRRASACLLVIERSSIPDGDARSHARMRFTHRHDATSSARPTLRAPQPVT